jgi:hypothetical protein
MGGRKLELVEGVEAFDIGPKLGLDVIDNGSLRFRDKTVPLRAMLMRYVQVSAEGTVRGLENTSAIKYGYGSMLNLRIQLVFGFSINYLLRPAGWLLELCRQIGTASHPVDRAFITEKVCLGLGILLSNRHVYDLYGAYLRELGSGNFSKADKLLASVHIFSSTFKAVASTPPAMQAASASTPSQTFSTTTPSPSSRPPACPSASP